MTSDEAIAAIETQIQWLSEPALPESLSKVQAGLEEQIALSFENKTDPDGNSWPPPARDYGWPLMVMTGSLYVAAIDQALAADVGPMSMSLQEPDEALPFYGPWHNTGLPNRRTPLPQREFLGFGETVIADAVEYAIGEANKKLLGAWD